MTLRQKVLSAKQSSKLGFVVCFINDGRIGVYTELDIRGDYTMGNIVQVKWGKEFYPARVIFLGPYKDACLEEERLLDELEHGELVASKEDGMLIQAPVRKKISADDLCSEETVLSGECALVASKDKTLPQAHLKAIRKRKLLPESCSEANSGINDDADLEEGSLFQQLEHGERIERKPQRNLTLTTKKSARKSKMKKSESTNKSSSKVSRKAAKDKKEKDFDVEVITVDEHTWTDDSDSPKVDENYKLDITPKKRLNISFSDEESLDSMTKVLQKVSKFKSTASVRCSPIKGKSVNVFEKSLSKVAEDVKILQRNVAVMQQDYQTLEQRVNYLESKLLMSNSTPNDSHNEQSSANSSLLLEQEQSTDSIESDCSNTINREDELIANKKPAESATAISVSKAQIMLKNRPYLLRIKAASSSIKNFAARLNSEIFTTTERSTQNVNGVGKPKLNEVKIAAIREAVFSSYPVELAEQEDTWKSCKVAIDTMNRKLKLH